MAVQVGSLQTCVGTLNHVEKNAVIDSKFFSFEYVHLGDEKTPSREKKISIFKRCTA